MKYCHFFRHCRRIAHAHIHNMGTNYKAYCESIFIYYLYTFPEFDDNILVFSLLFGRLLLDYAEFKS